MAGTGVVNGFYFDPEIFTEYMQEQPYVKDAIFASGVIRPDAAIAEAIGAKGSVGTIPMFASFDDNDEALNFDGTTDNVPQELTGKKQSFMKIGRMRAWKDKDFTRWLTGVSPLQNMADNLVAPYYINQWQKALIATLKGVMAVDGMQAHVTDLSVTSGSIADENKAEEGSMIELGAKALGDMADRFNLVLMHSVVYARLQRLDLINFSKYTINDAMKRDVELPTWNGKIVVVDDTLVDTTTVGFPVYYTYLLGEGAFLGQQFDIPNPYYTEYDPETDGGVNKLYTKQSMVMHPNGFNLLFNKIAGESPTNAELATAANWELAINHKNVAIALLKTNG